MFSSCYDDSELLAEDSLRLSDVIKYVNRGERMSWLQSNKEWLFSGVLVAVPLAIVGWLVAKKQKESSQKKVSQKQKSGDHSYNLQVGGNLEFNETSKSNETKPKSRK